MSFYMKNKIILLIFSTILAFTHINKQPAEITFFNLNQLDKLVQMNIDLDHRRTNKSVHAFVTPEEFKEISDLGFKIEYIPNQARLYFEELINDSQYNTNPMRSYHNYEELTEFLGNINIQKVVFRTTLCYLGSITVLV